MPFREIKEPSDFVRIKNNGNITISSSLIFLFKNEKSELSKVKIFHDEKNKLIGLKPDISGYKFWGSKCYRIKCAFLSKIITGEYYPRWSEKEKMLIFSYKPQSL